MTNSGKNSAQVYQSASASETIRPSRIGWFAYVYLTTASATLRKANAVEMPKPAIHQIRLERRLLTSLNKGTVVTSGNVGGMVPAHSGTHGPDVTVASVGFTSLDRQRAPTSPVRRLTSGIS